MNFMLDILLPKKEINKLDIKEFLFEWGGEEFSQDPPVYQNDTGLEFKQMQDLGYYERYFEENFAIFLIRDEEEIDARYRVNTKEDLTRIFCNCLNWDSPEGALITKLSDNK